MYYLCSSVKQFKKVAENVEPKYLYLSGNFLNFFLLQFYEE